MMENRYSKYLPNTVRELREFQRLGEIEAPILEEEAAAKEKLIRNQWIYTAERDGLLRLAAIIGIAEARLMETEALRQEILYRWNLRRPYTYFHLLDWLDGFCGAEWYEAIFYRAEYRLRLILETHIKEKKAFMESHLRKIIPANILLQIELRTNIHAELRPLTHAQIHAWTQGGLPLADLSPYQPEEG